MPPVRLQLLTLDNPTGGTEWRDGHGRNRDLATTYHQAAVTVDSVDAYLATLPSDQRSALERVRAQVKRLVPDGVEAISYGMPTFKLNGRAVVWFAGWKNHCAVYPLTDAFLAAHAEDLAGYGRTKGSLHFTPERPLPDALFEALVRERVADLQAT